MKVKVLVPQLCPTLCDSMDFSLPGSFVHGVFQARIREWVAIPFSREFSQPRDQTPVSCLIHQESPVSLYMLPNSAVILEQNEFLLILFVLWQLTHRLCVLRFKDEVVPSNPSNHVLFLDMKCYQINLPFYHMVFP